MTKPTFMDPRAAELVAELPEGLPRAPLPMPKQRLEHPASLLVRLWMVATGGLVARRVRH